MVSILPGGCSHLCSFRKSPNTVSRAYKASFSIRKETAVKAADGLALQGPELGLITFLLPGAGSRGAPELIPLGRGSKAWAPAQGCCFLFGGRNFEIKEK